MRRAILLLAVLVALGGCDDMSDAAQAEGLFAGSSDPRKIPSGTVEYQDKPTSAPPVTLALLRARTRALSHLLHALPFGARRRPRHDRAARLSRRRPPITSIVCARRRCSISTT